MGRDRHGFYEPQPVRPRRPRVRFHRHPHGLNRKVVVGHWQDEEVQSELGEWARAAAAWADWQGAKIARFGDNMRDVAVTEGDKVEAQIQLGYDVYGYGVGDLVKAVKEATDAEVKKMTQAYLDEYAVAPALQPAGEKYASLVEGARIEVGLRNFSRLGFQGLHHHLRRLARPGAASRPGCPTPDA